jgi:hypothetical protein
MSHKSRYIYVVSDSSDGSVFAYYAGSWGSKPNVGIF